MEERYPRSTWVYYLEGWLVGLDAACLLSVWFVDNIVRWWSIACRRDLSRFVKNNSVHVGGGPRGRCWRLTAVLLSYNDRRSLAWVMTSSRSVLCSWYGENFIRAIVCSDGHAAITLLAFAYHDDPNFGEACRWRDKPSERTSCSYRH